MGRDKFVIMRDICRVAGEECNKTRIVYRANLNFKIVDKFLDHLLGNGMLAQQGNRYATTPKGFEYVQDVEELESFFEREGT